MRREGNSQVSVCSSFDDVNGADSNFFEKIMTVIDKITPYRNQRIKRNIQKWFDSEVLVIFQKN